MSEAINILPALPSPAAGAAGAPGLAAAAAPGFAGELRLALGASGPVHGGPAAVPGAGDQPVGGAAVGQPLRRWLRAMLQRRLGAGAPLPMTEAPPRPLPGHPGQRSRGEPPALAAALAAGAMPPPMVAVDLTSAPAATPAAGAVAAGPVGAAGPTATQGLGAGAAVPVAMASVSGATPPLLSADPVPGTAVGSTSGDTASASPAQPGAAHAESFPGHGGLLSVLSGGSNPAVTAATNAVNLDAVTGAADAAGTAPQTAVVEGGLLPSGAGARRIPLPAVTPASQATAGPGTAGTPQAVVAAEPAPANPDDTRPGHRGAQKAPAPLPGSRIHANATAPATAPQAPPALVPTQPAAVPRHLAGAPRPERPEAEERRSDPGTEPISATSDPAGSLKSLPPAPAPDPGPVGRVSDTGGSAPPGPARGPDPVRPQAIIDQIAGHASLSRSGGETHLRVQLQPESLGQVTLRVSLAAGGSLHGSVTVSHPVVRDALLGALPELRQSLAEQGVRVESFTVSVGADGSGQEHRPPPQPERQWRTGPNAQPTPVGAAVRSVPHAEDHRLNALA